MGKSETASAALGLKVLLGELVLQINECNFQTVKKMLYAGCIEDSNGYYNEAYKNILGYGEEDNELPEDSAAFKQQVTDEFKKHGSFYKSKFDSRVEPDLSHGSLWEQYLLVPVKELLETERWGYERYGVNSGSRPLDFDLSLDLAPYAGIVPPNLVFIVKQHSG